MSAQELPGLPAGPIEMQPSGRFQPHAVQQRLLLAALAEAGVELGEYDRAIAAWLSRWDWTTVAVVASWVQRARVAGSGREWAVRVPGDGDGEDATFDVRTSQAEAEGALARCRDSHPGVELVSRTVSYGPWVAAEGGDVA